MRYARSAALLAVMMVVAGGIAFGLAEPAYALSTPSITTSQQPGSATVGSTIADKATVSNVAYTCPSQDQLGFSLGQSNTSTNPIFCSYPAVQGEDPTDFYCNYDATTGALTNDHDAGLCRATAVSTGDATPTGAVTFKLYDNSSGSGTPLFTDTENLVSGSATSAGYSTTATGTDYWVATYNGDSSNNSVSSGNGDEPVTVNQASPSVSTTASSGSVTVGQSISDQATVSGGYSPTGTVTFKLYSDSTCSTTALATDTENLVSGSATSAGYSTTATGTDYWVATYNGDSNNSSSSSLCSDEPVNVNQASPSVSTTASSGSVTVGQSISDKATVSGGYSPTGTVTFKLYDNSSATGTPLFTDTESLSGASATSSGYTTAATGTDYWVATYDGDGNNKSVSSGAADEPVTVNPVATPPPQNISKPWITGTTRVGQVLTSHLGTWTNAANLKYSRQWQRCPATGSGKCTNLPDYKTTYKLTSADAGHKITVVIKATDNHNQSQLAAANRVGPVTT